MRSEWPIVRLGDHCSKIGSGATPRGGREAYLDEGPYRLIRSQNVYNEGFAWQGLAFISEEQARKLEGVAVEACDVLVNITGDSVARVCTAPKAVLPARVNQHVAIVRPHPTSFDAHFLRWYLCSPEQQDKLLGLASAGATRNALTKAMLENLQVPKPPVQVQRELVAPLVAIEERIDLLRQTNATLEAIAQALFKSWFIDFDPVRAKQAGREPEGMDAATAALFPAEFEESALGWIPKGWQVSTLSEHVFAERGLSYKGAGLCNAGEGLPMHNLNSVLEGGGYKYAGIKHYSGDYKDRHLAAAGDVIVTNTEQGHEHRLIGFPAIIPARYPRAIFSHHIYRVRLKPGSPLTTHVLYYTLMAPAVREQVIGCANGSMVNMLKLAGLEIPQFVRPPAEVANAFEEVAGPIRKQIEANVERSEVLLIRPHEV